MLSAGHLKLEVIWYMNHTTWSHIPEHCPIHSHCCENLKSWM